MADYNISLGVTVDTSGIQGQINKIKNPQVTVDARLNTGSIQRQINRDVRANPILINVRLNANNVQQQINNIRQQLESLNNFQINLGRVRGGNVVGGNTVKNVDKTTNQLTTSYNKLKNIAKNIGSIKIKLSDGLDTSQDVKQIQTLESQLKLLTAEYHKTVNKIKGKGDISPAQWSSIQQQIDNTKIKLEQLGAKITDAKSKLANKIEVRLATGDFANQVNKVESDAKKLSVVNNGITNGIKNLNNALSSMNNAAKTGDIKGLINANREYERALKSVQNQIKMNARAERDAAAQQKLSDDRIAFQSKIDAWLKKNSAAAKKFGGAMIQLRSQAESCDKVTLGHLQSQFDQLDAKADAAGLKMQTFGDRIKTQFQRYSSYFSVATILMYTTRAVTSMFEQVKSIDSAMTELKKVTNETDASYNKFLDNAATRSKQLGTTIDGLVSSTADFARLGYSFNESQGLAEVANIYAVVGDEVEGVEGATQSLVSTMAAFKDEMNGMTDTEFALAIVDKMNEVANNFAISSGGIGEALQRSASSMAAANNTIDETIAMITAANEVAQNPEKVGNAMKTISMRIRGAKTELEEAGESTDGMVESTAKLRQEILALSDVDIMQDEDTFKSTYDIMDELSRKWKDLTDIQQATIIELIAGKHQGNIFSSLMSNFDTARDVLDTSLNASDGIGSAMTEHAKWSDSLEARLNKLKASWQSFSQTFMDSGSLKTGVDVLAGLVNGLDKMVNSLGSLGTIGFATGIVKIIKALNGFTNFKIFNAMPSNFKTFGLGVKALGHDLTSFMKTSAGVTTAIGLTVAAISLAVNAYKNYKEKISQARQETIKSSSDFLDASDAFEQAYIKYSGRTYLTSDEEADLQSAIQGTADALGNKSSALQNVINSSNDYLASLERIKQAELEAAKKAAKDKRDNAKLELQDAAGGVLGSKNSKFSIDLSSSEKDAINIAAEMDSEFFYKRAKRVGRGRSVIVEGFELSSDADTTEIIDYYDMLLKYQEKLSDADLVDTKAYERVSSTIGQMSEYIEVYTEGTYDLAKAQYQLTEGIPKTTEEYLKMREAILGSDDIKDLSVYTKKTIANALDSEYNQAFDLTTSKVQARKLIGVLDEYGEGEARQMEAFLNVRTAVNGNNCTIGQYFAELDKVNDITDGWSKEAKEEFNLAFGLDTDEIKAQYDKAYKYLSRNYLNKDTRKMDRDEEYDYKFKVKNVYEPKIEKFLGGMTRDEIIALNDIMPDIDWEKTSAKDIRRQLERQVQVNKALAFKADIEVDTAARETLNKALSESASAMGLTSESIDSLKSKYSELDNYNPDTLFDATANGVKVNRAEVAKLEKQYQDLEKAEVAKHIDTLAEEYNRLTEELNKTVDVNERTDLIAKRKSYASKIEELAQYQAQLEGVTGAYQRWLDAQQTPEDYEGYSAVAQSKKTVEDEIDRGFISNASKEYIDLLSGKDLRGGTIDDYAEAWGKLGDKVTSTGYSIHDFFTLNDDGNITSTGIHRFFESLQKDFDGNVAKFDEKTEQWTYDFSQENLQKIQDEWGIGIEAIGLLLEAAAAAGYDVDWDGILDNIDLDTAKFDTLLAYAEAAQKAFNEIEGIDNVDFNFETTNIEDATSELEKAKSVYEDLITNEDGSIDIDAPGAKEMRTMLSTLIRRKQELERPAIMDIEIPFSEAESNIGKATKAVQDLQTNLWKLERAEYDPKINTSKVNADIGKIMSQLNELEQADPNIYANLGLDATQVTNLKAAISNIQADVSAGVEVSQEDINVVKSTLQGIDAEAVVNYLSGEQDPAENKDALVDYKLGKQDSPVDKSALVNYKRGTQEDPVSKTVYVNYVDSGTGTGPAAGTAHAFGTSGMAFARGNWGLDNNGVALGGELGRELVVRDGRFFTIGDKGAEFFRYKKNDIVFNAAQTESLFRYGGIRGANPRGKMLATGSAFADGNVSSDGKALWSGSVTTSKFATAHSVGGSSTASKKPVAEVNVSATVTTSDFVNNKNKNSKKPTTGTGGGGDGEAAAAEAKETIDWIEKKIDRIERAIDKLDKSTNSIYKKWSERNEALADEISKVQEEIELQQKAYDRYIQEADSVGLDEAYAEKVRNGEIDIEGLNDEKLIEKIKKYEEWYNKALDCKDAIVELKETEAELFAQRVEHASTQYEGILGVIEHEKNMLEEYINQSEAQAWLVSAKYYDALAKNERENIAELQNQKSAMLVAFEEAMDSGTIAEGSESYYEMVNSIDEVTLAITESHTALLEYEQTIQQLDFEIFDTLQDRISAVTEETEFLIDLMSSDKLHNDNGQLTDEGKATIGLHGVAYNTYMHQADQAAAEIERLKKELAEDPYDMELEERYREMVSLQQEYILAAEDERDAIKSLVEEGIELEIEALEERIDKYNESINSAKDLYEYNKKVKEQTKEIASLEKQLSAYEGFTDEETKAKVQQIKVDLEAARDDLAETEYDKFIDSSEKLLDDLVLEYQETLNMRLDNIDALIESMIEEVNADASIIGDTIRETADSVGYVLSESMKTIWDENSVDTKNVITTYGDKFVNAQTTTNTALNAIIANLQNILTQLNSKATANVKSATTSSASKSSSTKTTKKTTTKKSSGDGKPKVGDRVKFVSGQYYYDSQGKKPLGSQKQGEYVYITNINEKDWATHPYHISTGTKLGKGDLGWLKLNQISGYATGKKKFFNDEIAWTQEDAQEFIIRPSDGAILTPIAKGDSVLTAAASNNIWRMANSPAEFIKENLNLGNANVPNNSSVQSNYTQYLDKVVFNLPNVQNYEEFLSAMRRDKNFERLVQSMTIDQVAGKSALGKGKSIR